jgi:hypothetical protein
MKRLFIETAAIALTLSFAAPTWAQKAEAPITSEPSGAAKPRPSPRIEMPDSPTAAQQATTEAAEPTQPRYHRARRKRTMPATHVDRSHVDRSAANAFTRQLNRQVLESLQSGGAVAPAGNPPYPAPAYPPR